MARIGFIGLGNMGLPMAANLVRAGHAVVGFDVVTPLRGKLAASGGLAAETIATACSGADAIITMLPASEHVCEGYWGPDGVIGAVGAGTLTFIVGGPDAAFARAHPILEAMGKTIVHAGGSGNGQAAKICNNMILGISMIAVGEAFILAEKLGLDHQKLFDISSKSSGQCWSLTSSCPVPGPVPSSPANRDYRPGFTAEMMLKDLRLSQEAAAKAGAVTPLGEAATTLYRRYAEAGSGTSDFSGIIRLLRGAR